MELLKQKILEEEQNNGHPYKGSRHFEDTFA